MSNLETYKNKKTINYYFNAEGLQLPEQTILKKNEDKLLNANVLDVGVGGGRTTPFFAKNADYYLGIDFSEEFIIHCQKKYKSAFPNAEFKTVDARSLEQMTPASFDIILFSFNGIDNVNNEERKNIIKTIYNLLKPSGCFIFSSHNINYLPILAKYKIYRNPFATLKTVIKHYNFLRKNNLALQNTKDYTFIYDDTYDFGLTTCYIEAKYQIKQLEEVRFSNCEIYSLNTGNKISITESETDKSAWLYYTCTK
ncbi:MAG: class I SAM-dependent methyltransferase [Bacteroidota bacterium]